MKKFIIAAMELVCDVQRYECGVPRWQVYHLMVFLLYSVKLCVQQLERVSQTLTTLYDVLLEFHPNLQKRFNILRERFDSIDDVFTCDINIEKCICLYTKHFLYNSVVFSATI